jgi:hypothetical protein
VEQHKSVDIGKATPVHRNDNNIDIKDSLLFTIYKRVQELEWRINKIERYLGIKKEHL